MIIAICAHCGAEFSYEPIHRHRRYCSPKCKRAFHKQKDRLAQATDKPGKRLRLPQLVSKARELRSGGKVIADIAKELSVSSGWVFKQTRDLPRPWSCRAIAERARHNAPKVPCLQCGKIYPKAYSKQEFCSKQCRKRYRYENGGRERYLHPTGPPLVCQHCGKSFIPKQKDRMMFCSRECAFQSDYRRELFRIREHERNAKLGHRIGPFCQIKTFACGACGNIITVHGEQIRKRKYCNSACSYQKNLRDKNNSYASKQQSERVAVCAECGAEYTTTIPEGRRTGGGVVAFCSEQCRKASAARRRRARKQGNGASRYSYGQVRAVSDGKCHICKMPTRDGLPWRHNLSQTIDHVVPLCLGGSDSLDNVRLAHLICNSIKSGFTMSDEIMALASQRVVAELIQAVESKTLRIGGQ